MCMWSDDGGWKVYREATRRAAKDHRCDECNRTIGKGESYLYVTGLSCDYDTWSTYRMCEQCSEVTRWLWEVCGGWMFEMTAEDVRNHVDGDEWYERTAPLVRMARWQEADWRDRNGNLRPIEDVSALVDRAIEASARKHAKTAA